MSSVDDVSEVLSKVEEYLQQFHINISEQCRSVKEYFKNDDGSVNADKLENVLHLLQELYQYLPDFTSADPVRLLQGVVGIMSLISSFTGLGGTVVPVICWVFSYVFTAFGGKSLTIGEVVESEIRRLFSGHSDETLLVEAEDLHYLYRFAFDFLTPKDEHSHFSKYDIINMNIQINVFQGATFLRKLGKLIQELSKEQAEDIANKKAERAKKAMDFIELYIKLASLRDMILTQFYTITSSTTHSKHLAGGIQRVIGSFDEQDREVLRFFRKPTKEYVYIVSYIREEERVLLMMFLQQKKLLPEHSWLLHGEFEIISKKWPDFRALRMRKHRSLFGNGDLRFIRGINEAVGPESLFCFQKVERNEFYVYITQRGNSDEFLTMTKGSNKWVMSLTGPPGPESEWKVIQMDNGNYVFSPRAFPDYFMGMTQLLDGSIAGFLGCSRTRCQWTLKASQ
ncbi:toxin CfTX-B-like [Ylistrum balloti]|uniref:toxin CfTX-B-like n=1 Tax=Ylistrum balloti TaxID=509963 RepID=UPI00290598DF|nr:toxin CfTX-B-like [Ylistrum balloti]